MGNSQQRMQRPAIKHAKAECPTHASPASELGLPYESSASVQPVEGVTAHQETGLQLATLHESDTVESSCSFIPLSVGNDQLGMVSTNNQVSGSESLILPASPATTVDDISAEMTEPGSTPLPCDTSNPAQHQHIDILQALPTTVTPKKVLSFSTNIQVAPATCKLEAPNLEPTEHSSSVTSATGNPDYDGACSHLEIPNSFSHIPCGVSTDSAMLTPTAEMAPLDPMIAATSSTVERSLCASNDHHSDSLSPQCFTPRCTKPLPGPAGHPAPSENKLGALQQLYSATADCATEQERTATQGASTAAAHLAGLPAEQGNSLNQTSTSNSVCMKCGALGHSSLACVAQYCSSCGKHGHPQGMCSSACCCCGKQHAQNNTQRQPDAVQCSMPRCMMCKLWGHTILQCGLVQCLKCGGFGHVVLNCPMSAVQQTSALQRALQQPATQNSNQSMCSNPFKASYNNSENQESAVVSTTDNSSPRFAAEQLLQEGTFRAAAAQPSTSFAAVPANYAGAIAQQQQQQWAAGQQPSWLRAAAVTMMSASGGAYSTPGVWCTYCLQHGHIASRCPDLYCHLVHAVLQQQSSAAVSLHPWQLFENPGHTTGSSSASANRNDEASQDAAMQQRCLSGDIHNQQSATHSPVSTVNLWCCTPVAGQSQEGQQERPHQPARLGHFCTGTGVFLPCYYHAEAHVVTGVSTLDSGMNSLAVLQQTSPADGNATATEQAAECNASSATHALSQQGNQASTDTTNASLARRSTRQQVRPMPDVSSSPSLIIRRTSSHRISDRCGNWVGSREWGSWGEAPETPTGTDLFTSSMYVPARVSDCGKQAGACATFGSQTMQTAANEIKEMAALKPVASAELERTRSAAGLATKLDGLDAANGTNRSTPAGAHGLCSAGSARIFSLAARQALASSNSCSGRHDTNWSSDALCIAGDSDKGVSSSAFCSSTSSKAASSLMNLPPQHSSGERVSGSPTIGKSHCGLEEVCITNMCIVKSSKHTVYHVKYGHLHGAAQSSMPQLEATATTKQPGHNTVAMGTVLAQAEGIACAGVTAAGVSGSKLKPIWDSWVKTRLCSQEQ